MLVDLQKNSRLDGGTERNEGPDSSDAVRNKINNNVYVTWSVESVDRSDFIVPYNGKKPTSMT